MLTLGSLFDGIGGWQLAAVHAGVEPVWSSEIEPFPCAVTAKHFPNTVQLGDITKLDGAKLWPVDIVCAGSPCQDLSVAGKQEGLKGARSGLFRNAVKLVRDMRRASGGRYPRFFVFENVPGLFSSNRGEDFRAVLQEIGEAEIPLPADGRWAPAGMVELPRGQIAWRTLDAQYWGVPQRRKRIFLVADFTGRSAGKILFEQQSLYGYFTQSRKERERTADRITGSPDGADDVLTFQNTGQGWWNKSPIAQTLRTPCGGDSTKANLVSMYDMTHADEVIRRVPDGRAPTLNARMGTGGNQVPVVIGNGQTNQSVGDKAGALNCMHDQQAVMVQKTVRRLTPTECERLQGLPDVYTLIDDKSCSDTARYKALGNGMAQPCADYVIRRIVEVVNDDRATGADAGAN